MLRLGPLSFALFISACAVSTQREVELGETYSAEINRQLPIIQDAEIQRYINVLGDSIARLADTRNLNWSFQVVDDRAVNAFAVPGGFIYVNRGLIERAANLSQLAGVLAHEIGHVTQRHSVKQMQGMQRANTGLTLVCVLTNVCDNDVAGAAIQVGGGLVFARFSREDEAEADAVAVDYVLRAHIDPRGIPEMFRTLMAERERSGGGVDSWFSTHPLEEDRVRDTERAIARTPASTLNGLTKDSPRFQAFKARLLALPRREVRR